MRTKKSSSPSLIKDKDVVGLIKSLIGEDEEELKKKKIILDVVKGEQEVIHNSTVNKLEIENKQSNYNILKIKEKAISNDFIRKDLIIKKFIECSNYIRDEVESTIKLIIKISSPSREEKLQIDEIVKELFDTIDNMKVEMNTIKNSDANTDPRNKNSKQDIGLKIGNDLSKINK